MKWETNPVRNAIVKTTPSQSPSSAATLGSCVPDAVARPGGYALAAVVVASAAVIRRRGAWGRSSGKHEG
ncbi:hypothetical protein [Frankia sp. EI5c]|uniref:hypothetical protein n=1 Tax=Frankia sp. EI5c TaxID=683316 RepID=UPI000FF8759D|nr:hypothetical protein [Frankia sp. EI5c]